MRIFLATVLTACVAALPGALPHAAAGGGQYVSSGTAVARVYGNTIIDGGTLVCDDGTGVGIGGFCAGFGGGNAVEVTDAIAGEDVAFSVCIDNSGDGICTSPDFSENCADVVVFSHGDDGSFYNPVGPLPTGFSGPQCGGGLAFNGYVVFLCEGAHVTESGAHVHPATRGSGDVVSGGEGSGEFCGGTVPVQARKAYVHGAPELRTAGYLGGCDLDVARDETPNQALGGQDGLTGTISVSITAADGGGVPNPLGSITEVRCDLYKDAMLHEYGALQAPDGTGTTAAARTIQLQARPSESIQLCTHVFVDYNLFYDCEDIRVRPVVPEPVAVLIESVGDTAKDQVLRQLDPTTCQQVGRHSGTYRDVAVTPDGDVYVGEDLVYDCPPYEQV